MNEILLRIALIYYVIINVVIFFMYDIDKAASKRGQSSARLSITKREQARTKSKWKAKKSKFKYGVPSIIIVQLTIIGYILYP